MARVWVTRAQPGAEATAERLRALGHEPVVAPLLEVRAVPGATVDLDGVAALAFSSANGVSAFAAQSDRRDLPAYAVGAATGEAARRAGFADVRAGDADVVALARLIAQDRRRPAGVVLHICPAEPAGDLVSLLAAAGVVARRAVLYETVAAAGTMTPLGLDCILVHSPKAGRALATLAIGDLQLVATPAAVLSQACADPLRAGGFTRIQVAAFPREEALLSLLRDD